MTTKLNSNVSMIAIGMNEVRKGESLQQAGIAHLAQGIYEAGEMPILVTYGEGDNRRVFNTNVWGLWKVVYKADGKEDGRYKPAAYKAFAEQYNLGELDGSDQQYILKASRLACSMKATEYKEKVEDDDGNEVEVTKSRIRVEGKYIVAPLADIVPIRDAHGKLNEFGEKIADKFKALAKMRREKLTDKQINDEINEIEVTCDGSEDEFYGKLPTTNKAIPLVQHYGMKAGLTKPVEPRAKKETADKVVNVDDAIAAILLDLDKATESDKSLPEEREKQYREISEYIAAYFSKAA